LEGARRQIPRGGRCRLPAGGGGARCTSLPASAVPASWPSTCRGWPGQLTLGTDNGSQFTSRDFRRHLSARGITHRRGGYRDPESQAFIESWFGQFEKRLAWRSEWESLSQARKEIAAYINGYHRRP
jgi:transposase InsO family protein